VAALIERFGKYHVLGRIARGGMAEIYKVKTVGLAGFEKVQALKRIRPHFAREPRFIRSFIDEARIAAELNHRNIVQVFDFGKAEGELFLAMELIEGVNLRTAMVDAKQQNIAMPVAIACYVLGEIAAGLEYAHRKTDNQGQLLGIVHCDVSPQNVMLSREGYIKILDFGVARARFGARQNNRRLRGKPRYMAPEQTRGEWPTPATDVFALGIVSWEVLTGMPLFEGSTLPEILAAVRRADAPRVDRLNPDVPAKVATALARALAREPTDRGTAGELAAVLSGTAQLVMPQTGARALTTWLARVYGWQSGELPAVPPPPPGLAPGRAPSRPGTDPGVRPVTVTGTATGTGDLNPTVRLRTGSGDLHVAGAASIDLSVATLDQPGPGTDFWDEPTAAETQQVTITGFREDIDEIVPDLPRLFEKRRVVAVAALLAGGEPAAQRELVGVLGNLAYKHGGVVHQQDATGLVAVFGLEVAGEDDVARAMSYALDAVEVTRETSLATRAGVDVHVAAQAGLVATQQDGSYRLVGNAIEETRALARTAAPGRPLLSGSGGRSTSAYYTFRPVPGRQYGNRRTRVVELVGLRSFDELRRALHTREGSFVGRGAELEALRQALRTAVTEDRRAVVGIIGGAGAGKSRLMAEFAAWARQSFEPRPVVVAVAATPIGRLAPFSLYLDIVQVSLNLPAGRGPAARTRLIRRLRHTLTEARFEARDVDEVVSSMQTAMELRDGTPLAPTDEPSVGLRERLVAGLRAWRETVLPVDRPCIMVIEDAHFIDEPSMDVLRGTMSTRMERTELILMTTRPSDAARLPEHLDATLVLGELDGADLDTLIRDRLGPAASERNVAVVAQRGGGSPFFIEQLAAMLRDQGVDEIPADVRAIILAAVDRLPQRAKTVLQYAAVAGRQVRARILDELVGVDIEDEIVILERHGLLHRAPHKPEDSEGEIGFYRGIVRDVVYEALSARARRDLHARLGQLLASRHHAGCDEVPAVIAEHLELGGERLAAAAFWLRAGRVALAAFDATAAVEYFSRTLALDEHAQHVAAPLSGRAATAAGDDLAADQTGAEARSAAARVRCREALSGREHAHGLLGQHEAQARDLAELDALAAQTPDDTALRADIERRRAALLLRRGEFHAALAAAEAAERAARALGDERGEALALSLRGQVYERLGAYDRSIEMNRGAQEIFRRIDAADDETRAMIGIGRALLTRAHYQEAQAVYDAILARVDQSGDPWLERQVRNHVAGIYLILGQFEQAMAAVQRCLDICRRYADRAREGDNLSMAGIILFQVGCHADARASFDQALRLHQLTDSRWSRADTLVYAGQVEAFLGAHDRAQAHLDEALSLARALGDPYLEANALVALAGALLVRDQHRARQTRSAPSTRDLARDLARDPARGGDLHRAARAAEDAVARARQATLIGAEIQALSRQAEATARLGQLPEALSLSQQAMDLLAQQKHIEGAEEEVYFVHFQLLTVEERTEDAAAVLDQARASMQRKLDALRDPRWREAFTHSIPVNARLRALTGACTPGAAP
jgi:predicted ATPase/tRNA A-37 threonylcarbamoyl transferase component Bud32